VIQVMNSPTIGSMCYAKWELFFLYDKRFTCVFILKF